jgi:hypothetical protein
MSGAISARFSVDQEIGIQRQDDMAIMDFRHLADACIGQRHRHYLHDCWRRSANDGDTR